MAFPLIAISITPVLLAIYIMPFFLEDNTCISLLVIPTLCGLFVLRTLHSVKPAEKLILVDMLGGPPELLSTGLHFRPSPFLTPLAPSKTSFKAFGRFPAPDSRVQIDPKPAQIHTKDDIHATADVSVECVVREWSPAACIRDSGCIQQRGCTIINQWLSGQMAQLSADECTYGRVNTFLNREEALDDLNAMLASGFTYIAAQRVVVDPDGIRMSPKWVQQREEIHQRRQLLSEREKVLEKERCLARLERETKQEATDFELATQHQRIVAELENSKLKLQHEMDANTKRASNELENSRARAEMEDSRESNRVQSMIRHGMTPEQCTRIAVARVHFETMADSTGTNYVSIPPGLLGLTQLSGIATNQNATNP